MTLSKDWCKTELSNIERDIEHRSIIEEYHFYNAVKSGDMEAVNKNCDEGAFTNPAGVGVLSKNPLTNIKYHFVVTAAFITRYCIEGGAGSRAGISFKRFLYFKDGLLYQY